MATEISRNARQRIVSITYSSGETVRMHRFHTFTSNGNDSWVSVPGCCPNDEHALTGPLD